MANEMGQDFQKTLDDGSFFKNLLKNGTVDKVNTEKEKADAKAHIEDLKKNLDDLKNKASNERKADENGPKKPLFDPKKIDYGAAQQNVGEMATTAKAAGLFNARAIQSLQNGPALDYAKRTAKAAEETAKNTRSKLTFKP